MECYRVQMLYILIVKLWNKFSVWIFHGIFSYFVSGLILYSLLCFIVNKIPTPSLRSLSLPACVCVCASSHHSRRMHSKNKNVLFLLQSSLFEIILYFLHSNNNFFAIYSHLQVFMSWVSIVKSLEGNWTRAKTTAKSTRTSCIDGNS